MINFGRIHTQTLITGSAGKQELNVDNSRQRGGTLWARRGNGRSPGSGGSHCRQAEDHGAEPGPRRLLPGVRARSRWLWEEMQGYGASSAPGPTRGDVCVAAPFVEDQPEALEFPEVP